MFCSGEALPYEVQQRFFERLQAELHNLYGPTEAAVDVTYWALHEGLRQQDCAHRATYSEHADCDSRRAAANRFPSESRGSCTSAASISHEGISISRI